MSVVEQMAKAMYLAYANHPDANWDYVDPMMQEGVWKLQARAALAAIRTPTPAVIEAMRREIGPLATMWTAAIDAILSEEGE